MLSHILYGTASLTHGNLTFAARAAGKRGEQVSLTITTGSPLSVSAVVKALGVGDISVIAPDGTTEQQLFDALKASASFKNLASVKQTDDGADTVTALAKTQFGPAAGGLRQQLEARLAVLGWDDRDVTATGAAVGLLMPWEAEIERIALEQDGFDRWKGSFYLGLAFQQNLEMEVQYATADMFRRAVYQAVKLFDHDDLTDIGPVTFGYSNRLKDEASGQPFDHARVRIAASCPIQWQEPAFDPEDITEAPLDHVQIGLFREPIDTDVRVVGDGDVKDQDLVIEQ